MALLVAVEGRASSARQLATFPLHRAAILRSCGGPGAARYPIFNLPTPVS